MGGTGPARPGLRRIGAAPSKTAMVQQSSAVASPHGLYGPIPACQAKARTLDAMDSPRATPVMARREEGTTIGVVGWDGLDGTNAMPVRTRDGPHKATPLPCVVSVLVAVLRAASPTAVGVGRTKGPSSARASTRPATGHIALLPVRGTTEMGSATAGALPTVVGLLPASRPLLPGVRVQPSASAPEAAPMILAVTAPRPALGQALGLAAKACSARLRSSVARTTRTTVQVAGLWLL